jgi:hypothetical protein
MPPTPSVAQRSTWARYGSTVDVVLRARRAWPNRPAQRRVIRQRCFRGQPHPWLAASPRRAATFGRPIRRERAISRSESPWRKPQLEATQLGAICLMRSSISADTRRGGVCMRSRKDGTCATMYEETHRLARVMAYQLFCRVPHGRPSHLLRHCVGDPQKGSAGVNNTTSARRTSFDELTCLDPHS